MAEVESTTGGPLGRIDEGMNPAGGTMTHDLTPALDCNGSPWPARRITRTSSYSRRWGLMIAAFRPEFNAWFSRMQCPAALNDDDAEHFTHWMPLPEAERADGARATVTGLPPRLARFLERASTRDAA